MMGWFLRFFRKTQPPDRSTTTVPRDPDIDAAKLAYQAEKDAAMQKQIEILARLNRMGYDVDAATRRNRDYVP